MTDRNPNAVEAEDLLDASLAAHMHLDRLHKAPVDNRSQIAQANQRIGISLKMADARATLAVAEEQRHTRNTLEKISATLGTIAERLTEALNVSGSHEGEGRA